MRKLSYAAAGRRCDDYSMVIDRSAVAQQDEPSPVKQSRSSLVHDLDARAVIALASTAGQRLRNC